jgi:hypothetical protein
MSRNAHGWVPNHRKDTQSIAMQGNEALGVWTKLQAWASRDEIVISHNGGTTVFPKGTVVTSLSELAGSKKAADIQRARRFLKFLQRSGYIDRKSSEKGQIIKVLDRNSKQQKIPDYTIARNVINRTPRVSPTDNVLAGEKENGTSVNNGNYEGNVIDFAEAKKMSEQKKQGVYRCRTLNGEEENIYKYSVGVNEIHSPNSDSQSLIIQTPNQNLPEAKPRKALVKDPVVQQGMRSFISAYIKAFQARYDFRPILTGKEMGLIKSLIKSIPIDQACDLIQVYCQMEDQWFEKKYHDIPTFLANLNKVKHSLKTGKADRDNTDWATVFGG